MECNEGDMWEWIGVMVVWEPHGYTPMWPAGLLTDADQATTSSHDRSGKTNLQPPHPNAQIIYLQFTAHEDWNIRLPIVYNIENKTNNLPKFELCK